MICQRRTEVLPLYLSGIDDIVIPSQNSFIMGKQTYGASVIQIKGGSHRLMYQYPQKADDFVITLSDGSNPIF
jgi:hypothetical protein